MIVKNKKWAMPLLAVAILVGCNTSEGSSDGTAEEEAASIYPVEVSEVTTGVLSDEIKLSGNVMASKHLPVLSMLTGEVTNVHVSNGDVVERGDVLIELDASDVELNVAQAKAGLKAARANLAGAKAMREQSMKQAQLQLDQATELLEQLNNLDETDVSETIDPDVLPTELQQLLQRLATSNMPTEVDRKQAEMAVELAQSALNQAKATTQIEAAEASVKQAEIGVEMAEKQRTNAVVRAPIAGQVTGFSATVGGMVSPQAPLMQIVQMEQPLVRLSVNESMLALMKEDQEVSVQIKSLNKSYDGVITYISIMPGEQSRSYPVEIKIDNHDNDLRIGMLAEVIVSVSNPVEEVLAPVDAILTENNTTVAYVTNDGETVERRDVTISTETASYFAIEAGLEAGDIVVVRGAHQLYDGASINIRNDEVFKNRQKSDDDKASDQ